MSENSKGTIAGILGAGIKSVTLFILVCAAIALAGIALGIVFAAGALLLLLLIFALIVNPGEVKTLVKVLGDKISDLISRLEALVASMKEIIEEISSVARAASGMASEAQQGQGQAPQEATPADVSTQEAIEAPSQEKPQKPA
ncbi:MAG: hypothetical protein Q4E62_01325 [Sutterellaceae bacterium]|nr:hypothetical protein [Sutterellaceae bacterium]